MSLVRAAAALLRPLVPASRGTLSLGKRHLSSQAGEQQEQQQAGAEGQQQQPEAGATWDCSSGSGEEEVRPKHIKHKIPRKRASYLLSVLQKENMAARPLNFPHFKTGDAIECQMLPHMSSEETEAVRGIVLGRFNRGIASSFIIRDVLYDEPLERRIPLYSPLLRGIRVIKRRAIYEGKQEGKRVRPSKLYYLRDRDNRFSQVTGRLFGDADDPNWGKDPKDLKKKRK